MQLVYEEQQYDEIGQSQDDQNVSASAAIWRVDQIEIYYENPTVIGLDFHLENHHRVYFKVNQLSCAIR